MKFLATLLLLALVAALALGVVLYLPYGPHTETFVDIPAGTSSPQIAATLENSGIILNRFGFDLERLHRGGTLKAGEYRFDHPVPLAEVYDRLLRGDVYTRTVTIPEGFNLFDIATAVQAAGLGSREDFLRAAHTQTELIETWSPHATSLEGFLFPDTYKFSRHTTPDQMLAAMVRRFRQAVTQLGLNGDIARTVVLASLIEKEVRQPEERPLVAGVFLNRIAVGMPLATDPTVIYAALLENRYRGTIYASDLQSPSPYNTYKHAGLPPGPICSPGVASLNAAMHPARTDFLYFVADANGHSRFSTGLKEHAAQVDAYRKSQPATPQTQHTAPLPHPR